MAGVLIPASDRRQDDHAGQRQQREPGKTALTPWQDEERRNERAKRIAEIAADLEQRLRETVRATGSQPRQPRRFRMEDRRTDAHQCGTGEQRDKGRRESNGSKPYKHARHAERQRIGLRPAIGEETDDGLQERCDALINEGQKTDLAEGKIEPALENRINGRQQRCRQIIEQVAEGNRGKNRECGVGLLPANNSFSHGVGIPYSPFVDCSRDGALPQRVLWGPYPYVVRHKERRSKSEVRRLSQSCIAPMR